MSLTRRLLLVGLAAAVYTTAPCGCHATSTPDVRATLPLPRSSLALPLAVHPHSIAFSLLGGGISMAAARSMNPTAAASSSASDTPPSTGKPRSARGAEGRQTATPGNDKRMKLRRNAKLRQRLMQVAYLASSIDAVIAVIRDDYRIHILVKENPREYFATQGVAAAIIPKLFYFARLRPRLLFSVGALLRTLQLCTPLQRVLDPSAGVGLGVSFCTILASSRWISPLVLGWSLSARVWRWLGATAPPGVQVPIAVSLHRKNIENAIWGTGRSSPKDDE